MKVKKILKKVGLGLIVLIAILVVWQYELVSYGMMQLRGQLKVINQSVPLEEFLADSTTTAEQREKVKIILESLSALILYIVCKIF